MTPAIDIAAIPHRAPFLFVDEVHEVGDDRIVTSWQAKAGADFFRGHYPDQPVMPGVLICECCFQAGALLIAYRVGAGDLGGDNNVIPVLTRIRDARFRRIVRPSETLCITVTLDDELDNAYYMSGTVEVAGRRCVSVRFVCMATADEGGAS